MVSKIILFVIIFVFAFNFCRAKTTFNERVSSDFADTVKKYICISGKHSEIMNLGFVPVKISGHVFYKTYFTFSSFWQQFYDYIGTINDTVYIIRGTHDTSDDSLFNKKDVLCVLKNNHQTYKRKIYINNNFFKCFVFERNYFSSRVKGFIYRFRLESCDDRSMSDIPFLKQICFAQNGEIVAFVVDKVDKVLSCKLVE